jgi:hypothetical protein
MRPLRIFSALIAIFVALACVAAATSHKTPVLPDPEAVAAP